MLWWLLGINPLPLHIISSPSLPLPPVQEVKKFETILNRQELAALHHDVDGLRGELLRLEQEWRTAQVIGCCAERSRGVLRTLRTPRPCVQ